MDKKAKSVGTKGKSRIQTKAEKMHKTVAKCQKKGESRKQREAAGFSGIKQKVYF
ncbi:hypothetical protein [Sideroxydans sp.]